VSDHKAFQRVKVLASDVDGQFEACAGKHDIGGMQWEEKIGHVDWVLGVILENKTYIYHVLRRSKARRLNMSGRWSCMHAFGKQRNQA
jgi:hypothetical protein